MSNAPMYSEGESRERVLADLGRLGSAIYENRLRSELQKSCQGSFVAIHVDSGDYAVARTAGSAVRSLLERRPADGRVFTRRIGDEPEYELAARASVTLGRTGGPK